jgi:hypothetical protein
MKIRNAVPVPGLVAIRESVAPVNIFWRSKSLSRFNEFFMGISEQFKELVEKEQEPAMLELLRTASQEQRKELVPIIKKLERHYFQYVEGANGSSRTRGSQEQRSMLQLAGFVCFSRSEFEKIFPAFGILQRSQYEKLFDWFRPPWLSDYINNAAGDENSFYLNYDQVMELEAQGILQPSRELIARTLPRYIFEHTNDPEWRYIYKPEKLLKYEATLLEHIWYIFEVDTTIHHIQGSILFGENQGTQELGWVTAFLDFSAEGKIDRQRLIRESLLAANRNFNKNLSGWFIGLLEKLEPLEKELLPLQQELLAVLASPHSKVVNTALRQIKKIAKEKTFNAVAFLDSVPLLLSTETKSIVLSAMQLLEKLAQQKPELSRKIAILAAQAFLHQDEGIQTRTAKIIEKFIDKADPELMAALQPYQQSMMQSAVRLLDFLPVNNEEEATGDHTSQDTEHAAEEKWQALPTLESWDDLVFLASQAFDNNESWHIDLIPAALINWQHQIKGEHIDRLEPALQRAIKLSLRDFRSTQGFLDHMLAIFFVDYCIQLVRKWPGESTTLKELFAKYDERDGEEIKSWLAIAPDKAYIDGWSKYGDDPFYTGYKNFLIEVLQKLNAGDSLPLLSTPTHEPAWVSPQTLVERLLKYQEAGRQPASMDFQMALARCHPALYEEPAGSLIEQLTGEIKDLLLFRLHQRRELPASTAYPDLWVTALLSQTNKIFHPVLEQWGYAETDFYRWAGRTNWQTIEEEYAVKYYDYQQKKYITAIRRHKILKLDLYGTARKEVKGFSKLMSKLLPAKKEAPSPFLKYWQIKSLYFENEGNDVRRTLLLAPANPEAFLLPVLQRVMMHSDFAGEGSKRIAIALLQTLYELNIPFSETGHLFIATAMLMNDKTASALAAELWIKGVVRNQLDPAEMGRIIGNHQRIEFAPLQRLSNLILQQMFRLSAAHNRALQIMLENIFVQLPPQPIKNLKKLLEIYGELLALNSSPPPARVLQRLEDWKSTNSLKKLVEGMLERG